ncbi:MAG: hypothetical protein HDR55_05775 [Treponema sp.]|nr:hypothetical protein [Treponema sp.]
MKKWIKCPVGFWLWIAVTLVSFMMLVVSVVASPIPKVAVTVFAVVIFALSIAVPIINPGIFARQTKTATGV